MGSLQPWEQIVSRKRAIRDQALKPHIVSDIGNRPPRIHAVQDRSCIKDDPLVQEITDIHSVPSLVEQLRRGHFSAEQVTRAYIKR